MPDRPYGQGIVVDLAVELSPHLDLWMQGARYGMVLSVKDGNARVQMDHPAVKKPRKFKVADLQRR